MCLNHSETIPTPNSGPWKNFFSQNWSPVLKRLGTTALKTWLNWKQKEREKFSFVKSEINQGLEWLRHRGWLGNWQKIRPDGWWKVRLVSECKGNGFTTHRWDQEKCGVWREGSSAIWVAILGKVGSGRLPSTPRHCPVPESWLCKSLAVLPSTRCLNRLFLCFWFCKMLLLQPLNFIFFSISGWGIDLDYCDVQWFSLETNWDHSAVFEAAPKYCILDSLVDSEGYSISSKGFLPRVVDIMSSPDQGAKWCPLHCRADS